MLKKIIYLIFIIGAANACKCDSSNESLELEDENIEGSTPISDETIEEIIENVSSPVEMAALIKDLGVQYSNRFLASTNNADEFATSFDQAFNLGIFGADLGYLNIYNKTSSVLQYISAINTLADKLRVGQFFDFVTLKRLAQNSQNLDSLMYISVHSFNEMDSYLKNSNRRNLSSLIIVGVWVESLYLATQVAKDNPHPELAERIGEQKIVLEKLLLIIENYKSDKRFANLLIELKTINKEYKDIEITYIPGEPEAIVENGTLIIKQNEKSVVNITEQQLNKIIKIAEEVRNRLIKI